jgi:hypothetical protein
MNDNIRKAIIEYLKSVIDFDPQINPQNMGECFYCGSALDEGKEHKENCHYLEAKRLLAEFKRKG